MKTSLAHRKYMKRWRKRNPIIARICSYRTSARTFVRHYASLEDLEQLKKMINRKETQKEKTLPHPKSV